MRGALDVRYEEAGKLHITLAFLGNVDAPGQADAILALEQAANAEPFYALFESVPGGATTRYAVKTTSRLRPTRDA